MVPADDMVVTSMNELFHVKPGYGGKRILAITPNLMAVG